MGSRKKKSYVAGYKYYGSVHMVLCHSGARVTKVIVGDKNVWSGDMLNGSFHIDAQNIFGGMDGEGGIAGPVDVLGGLPTQAPHSYLSSALGGVVPAFKGVLSVVLRHFMLCYMNPYPKPWRFQVRRIVSAFEGSSGDIDGFAMNPAHIIAECLLNKEWGLGVPYNDLDIKSFQIAAQQLQKERLGLCMRWEQTEPIENFIQEILDIIDGSWTMDPVTGKHGLFLVRFDYNIATLPRFTEDDIIELTNFTRSGPDEIGNEVVVVFEDWRTGIEQSVTERNTAALAINPSVNSVKYLYRGIPTQELARRIALRELGQIANCPAKFTIKTTRKGASIKMGQAFIVSYKVDNLNIESMIVRAVSVSAGESSDWSVQIQCVEDIFGMPETKFIEQESSWKPPTRTPELPREFLIFEVPYHLVVHYLTGEGERALEDLPPFYGFLATCAAQPSGNTIGYRVYAPNNYGVYEVLRENAFHDWGRLGESINAAQTTFKFIPGYVDEYTINTFLYVGNELMFLKSIDQKAGTISVWRGCLDTVATAHAADSFIWLLEEYNSAIPTVYVKSQTPNFRIQSYSTSEAIPLNSCPVKSATIQGRALMPLPPGNIQINYRRHPRHSNGTNIVSFSRKDRLRTGIVQHDASGDVLPEQGTRYVLHFRYKQYLNSNWIYGDSIRTESNTVDMKKFSSQLLKASIVSIWIETFSNNGKSLQTPTIEYEHIGWGYQFNKYWGGVV